MNIDFSIIVPCFNQGTFLSECIQSVLSQKIQNWECIIVDDGSTDNTNEITGEFITKDSRIKYLYKINGGLSSARNAGIKIAFGQYILPLDADDKISEGYLSSALKIFSQLPETKLVYGNAYRFGEEDCFWDMGKYSFSKLLLENQIFCSAIFRKSDWEKCGGYDENIKIGWEDWEFWINMLDEKDYVHKIDDVVFFYRIRKNSMLRETSHQKYLSILRYIYHKHWSKYIDIYGDPLKAYQKAEYYKNIEMSTKTKSHFKKIISKFKR